MPRLARVDLLTAAAVAIAAAFVAQAQAQGIYRSTGPDGKVTYSDVPPTGSSQVDVLRAPKPVQGPLVPPGPGSIAAPAAASPAAPGPGAPGAMPRAKPATAAAKPTPDAPVAAVAPADPAREKAVIGVLGVEDLVRQTVEVCARTLPTSFRRYADAADAWKQRNGPLVEQARRVLAAEFGPAERRVIELGILERNRGVIRPVSDAGTHQRIQWCDRSAVSISDGSMDVRDKPRLADPLLAARAR